MSDDFGVYVHVPYCAARCPYCDFNVTVERRPPWPAFAQRVAREIAARAEVFPDAVARSLYFGGGTPSLAPADALQAIMSAARATFAFTDDCELTVEVNPASIDAAGLGALRRIGLNRVSLGWQSTHDALLRTLGRAHSAADSRECLVAAQRAGFDNVSLDLIFAVPGQTLANLEHDLDAIEELAPEHVSLYALTYKPGTEMKRRVESNRLAACDEELELAMMLRIEERLVAAGYEHYEVSNFARPGRRAVHNTLYWTGGPYLGVGPGAHSFAHERFARGWRWESRRDVARYLEAWSAPQRGGLPQDGDPGVEWVETLSARQLMTERMLCGLRMTDGVDLGEPALSAQREHVLTVARDAAGLGWLTVQGDSLRPTSAGLRHADALAALFF